MKLSIILQLCDIVIIFSEQIDFEEVSIAGGVPQSGSVGVGEASAGVKDERANGSGGDKPVKKESAAGNLEAGRPKQSKTSRRTTSLLNLFMPNSQGMSVVDVSFYRAGIFI